MVTGIPTSFNAILFIMLLIVPGFLLTRVRDSFITSTIRSPQEQIIESIIWSCVNAIPAILIITITSRFIKSSYYQTLAVLATLFSFFLITPILFGIGAARTSQKEWWFGFGKALGLTTKSRDPEVWDKIFAREYRWWVKVFLKSGKIYQGQARYISSYPCEKQLFLTHVRELDKNGNKIRDLGNGSNGVYIDGKEIEAIELFE